MKSLVLTTVVATIVVAAPGRAHAQLVMPDRAKEAAGCYAVQPGEWDLGSWDGTVEEIPPIPVAIELKAAFRGPPPQLPSVHPHVVSNNIRPLHAVSRDANGQPVPSFDAWFSRVGRISIRSTLGPAEGGFVILVELGPDPTFPPRLGWLPAWFSGSPPFMDIGFERIECQRTEVWRPTVPPL